MHLKELKQIVEQIDGKYLFPCIKDLLTNGVSSARRSSEDSRPSRQDITQYLAAWFKYIGISADECRDWMIGYCVEVLSTISSSSKSRIRHSTKSNIKYIYKSDVSFDCGCENNTVKLSCEQNCPVYKRMLNKYKRRKAKEAARSYEPEYRPKHNEEPVATPSVKEIWSDQFKKALEFLKDNVRKGTPHRNIVTLLNDRGFKTRTGKKWTYGVLRLEIKRYKFEPELANNQVRQQRLSIKARYSDQFEKGLKIVQDHVKKGVSKQDIVTLLNDAGFKTRTGRKWTLPVLQSEIKKSLDIKY